MRTQSVSETDAENETADDDGEDRFLPISYKWLRVAFYGGILLWVGYLMMEALTWDRYEDWIVPLVGGSLLALLLLLQLAEIVLPESMRPSALAPGDSDDETSEIETLIAAGTTNEQTVPKAVRDRKTLVLSGWILALPVLLYLFGFVVVLPLYLLLLEYFLTRSVKRAVFVTVIALSIIYVVFIVILEVNLWAGVVDLPFTG